jgi:hypothetical protein
VPVKGNEVSRHLEIAACRAAQQLQKRRCRCSSGKFLNFVGRGLSGFQGTNQNWSAIRESAVRDEWTDTTILRLDVTASWSEPLKVGRGDRIDSQSVGYQEMRRKTRRITGRNIKEQV